MRLIYVTSTFPFGPGEAFVIPELEALARQGHEILIAPMRPRGDVVHGAGRRWLPSTRKTGLLSAAVLGAALGELPRNLPLPLHLGRMLAREPRPVVLLTSAAVFPKALWLARVARNWGAEHIHAYWASGAASLAMLAAEAAGIPWSFTAHRQDIVQRLLLEEKARRATFVRFISRSGLEMSGLSFSPWRAKTAVIHVGVDLPADEVPEPAPAAEKFVVLCPANLVDVKGHRFLIDAMARLQAQDVAVELWLAGQGPLQQSLMEQVQTLRLGDRVRFLGQLARERLLELYRTRAVSAIALASLDLGNGLHEGIPVSLMEAMSYAVPVIATRTGGIPELLSGGAGLMVEPASAPALAEAMRRLANDESLRSRLAAAGRKRIEDRFAAPVVAAQLAKLFGHPSRENFRVAASQ
jgi:glycosyltransferase involved in cell wall biosynthesis